MRWPSFIAEHFNQWPGILDHCLPDNPVVDFAVLVSDQIAKRFRFSDWESWYPCAEIIREGVRRLTDDLRLLLGASLKDLFVVEPFPPALDNLA